MANMYGLIRVSTRKQNVDRQIEEMLKYSIPKENIVTEKESGKSLDRKKYNGLKRKLKQGDILYIESIDRLGRNYNSILNEWNYLTKQKNVIIKVIATPILDTDINTTDLIDLFIKDVTLLLLSFQAEQEYKESKRRQAQGIAIAKQQGRKLGRPTKPISQDEIEIVSLWKQGTITPQEAMQKLKIKKSAFYDLIDKIENKEG